MLINLPNETQNRSVFAEIKLFFNKIAPMMVKSNFEADNFAIILLILLKIINNFSLDINI
jgi:hypothetical protein